MSLTFSGKLLQALSRDPRLQEPENEEPPSVDNALDLLQGRFGDISEKYRSKRVLDLGCGSGYQAAAFALGGAAYVLGVDSNPSTLSGARRLATRLGIGEQRLDFRETLPDEVVGTFDLVISQNSMEHFANPADALGVMLRALNPAGELIITFGPPWFAPYGAHMFFFTAVPWVHLIFSEKTVLAVRGLYRQDGARRYEEVESGLNRMSVARFERMLETAGVEVVFREYAVVKGVWPLGRIPYLRELFINNVACIVKPVSPTARSQPRQHDRDSNGFPDRPVAKELRPVPARR